MLEPVGQHIDDPLYSVHLADFDTELPEPFIRANHFRCLLAANFDAASDSAIMSLGERLFVRGARYFVCWGPDCERAHDLIDTMLLEHDADPTTESVVMTTWHDDEPLSEALFFLLCAAFPADEYFESARSCIGVSVSSLETDQEVREAFTKPDEFIARCSAA